ncbi:MAG: 50S ribosomal protein L4 [Kiritimatiellia bacterium]
MSTISVMDKQGAPAGNLEIPDALLERDRGGQAVQDTLVAFRAGLRAGTASTLNKSGINASNKKPWRQKGTGRARAGYRSSPVWRGGGTAFGPHPRSYAKSVNRKTARLAFKRVFSDKLDAGAIRVIEQFDLPDGKTKSMTALLAGLQLSGKLMVLAGAPSVELERATRNLAKVELVRARDVNTYQMLCYPVVLADRAALDMIINRLQGKSKVVAE